MKSIRDSRNLSPLLKSEITQVLDFAFKGRPVKSELEYFTIVAEPRKTTNVNDLNRTLVYVNDDEHSRIFVRDYPTSRAIIMPVVGVGSSYKDQCKIYNRIGMFLSQYLIDYDDQKVHTDVLDSIYDYGQLDDKGSTSVFWDGYELRVEKYPLLLNKMQEYFCKGDRKFRSSYYYAMFSEQRRFGYKNDKVFFYKGSQKREMRIGKALKQIAKLTKREHIWNDAKVQEVSNYIKAANAPYDLKLVEGEDIRKYYHQDRNKAVGTLGSSCMRHPNCQKYFDIYVDNAKMLVLLQEGRDVIRARALLWEATDGTKIMDRIYGQDRDYHLFFNWAKENGYIYKTWQSNSNVDEWTAPQTGKQFCKEYSIEIPNIRKYVYAPYFDTFSIADLENNQLHNVTPPNFMSYRSWRSTGGGT